MFSPPKLSLTIWGIKHIHLPLLSVFYQTQPSSTQIFCFDFEKQNNKHFIQLLYLAPSLFTFESVCCKWFYFRPSLDWAWWRESAFEPTTPERLAFVGSEIRKCEEVWKSIPRQDNRRMAESRLLRVSDPC